ncbi:hypothetical protein [Intrasporangium sp. DVR]|uniref:hypothetical protein n=1 Tax=Intrasporangium sp. DVR TaxID=3127867 RepID=UPI00313A74B7
MNDRDLEAEFERIVAGWDSEAPDPQGPTTRSSDPAIPDTSAPSTSSEQPADPSAPATPSPPSPPSPPMPGGPIKDAGLNLPIAPTTAHVWRGSEPLHDDVDDLLESVGAGADGASDDSLADGDEDHFTPPTEMDLPTAEEDPMFWAIVGGLGGGTLLLLYVLFFDRGGSAWWIITAITMIVVGFVLLVLRGGTERDPFDDGTRV